MMTNWNTQMSLQHWLIALALIVLLVAIISYRMYQAGGRIDDYFKNAVMVWILTGEEASKLAALTAAKTASRTQREGMIEWLSSMEGAMDISSNPILKFRADVIKPLAEEICSRDWTLKEVIVSKQELERVDPEYYHALGRSDPNVFKDRHPQILNGDEA
jgi:hypothetical protein